MTKKEIFWLAGLSLAGATANGCGFLWVEFQNNNQSEYYEPVSGTVDVPYAASAFLVAFLPTAIVLFPVILFVYAITISVWKTFRDMA